MTHYRVTQIEDYEPLVGTEVIQRIRDKSAKLTGLRVANFNSTYCGGGVAEIISSLTLLMNSLGLRTEWRVIQGRPDFFSITKKMHKCPAECRNRSLQDQKRELRASDLRE